MQLHASFAPVDVYCMRMRKLPNVAFKQLGRHVVERACKAHVTLRWQAPLCYECTHPRMYLCRPCIVNEQ